MNQFCHSCGNQLPSDSVFCGVCGARAAAAQPATPPAVAAPVSQPYAAPSPAVATPAVSSPVGPNYDERVRHLFDQAGAVDPSRREAWLQAVCQGDQQLLNQLRGMLTIQAPQESPNAHLPTVTHITPLTPPHAAQPWTPQPGPSGFSSPQAATGIGISNLSGGRSVPQLIGPYRLLRELGRGGMGVVYLAARDDGTFRKNVALKLLLRDQVNEEFVLRFKQERQVLAALDHPNIARILDGGDAPDGMPYYVMEYIEGLPLDGYCDQQRLSVTGRIKIFQQVCLAVHYLHTNSIVHRDLKPSNILVSGDGVVKLLDFGIAKVVGAASFATPDLTTIQGRPMTPTYASPEQINGATLQKASDIYSLGVVLYQLLTGRSPYQGLDDKLAKLAAQQDPPPPSSNIREDLRAQETTAQLRRAMLGELDSIVMMALRFDPRDRYQSASDLAGDLQRFMDGQPVTAHHGNMAGRGVKLLKRKRAVVAIVAMFLILIGLGGWQFWRFEMDRRETAAKIESLNTLLNQLEARQNATAQSPAPAPQSTQSAANSPTPDAAPTMTAQAPPATDPQVSQQIEDVQKLQKALKANLSVLAARSGKSPERDALVERSVRYLDRAQAQSPSDPGLNLEIASGYEQIGLVQEKTAATPANKTAAVNTYRKAAVTLSAAAPQNPQAQQRLAEVNQRIQSLGGTAVTKVDEPPPPQPEPQPETKVEPPPVVEKTPPPVIHAPPPKGVTPPPQPEPVIDKPKPSVPTPPESSMPQITAAEKRELQELLLNATSKVQIADATIAPVKQNLERTGQSLTPDILSAMNNMHAALERAKREIAFGNSAAARESIAAADGLATKVLRSVGR